MTPRPKTWQRLKHDPHLRMVLTQRAKITQSIRAFFTQEGFLEVETPLLVGVPSTETYLDFFQTELRMAEGQQRVGYLTTSPEYALKKILSADVPRVFQVCKSFRNGEGMSSRHNPEFTILEWYRTQADYQDIMQDCEQLFHHIWAEVQPAAAAQGILSYQGRDFQMAEPWLRLSVPEAFERFAGVTLEQLLADDELKSIAARKGYQVSDTTTWEQAYHQIFLNEVEPQLAALSQPVFLYDYPASQAALSRRKASDPRLAERFEWYLGGIELGNAFSELLDADEQAARLQADIEIRRAEHRPPYDIDSDLLAALRTGFPPTGGIAVGVDRLVMLLTDSASIKQTLIFPVEDVFQLE